MTKFITLDKNIEDAIDFNSLPIAYPVKSMNQSVVGKCQFTKEKNEFGAKFYLSENELFDFNNFSWCSLLDKTCNEYPKMFYILIFFENDTLIVDFSNGKAFEDKIFVESVAEIKKLLFKIKKINLPPPKPYI